MCARLADHLQAARHDLFVGRDAELALFRSALESVPPPFYVLYLYGPGGVGKSSLLREYGRMAEEAGQRALLVDAHNLEPAPDSFLAALGHAQGLSGGDNPLADLISRPQRQLLLIDTYENLRPMETWLREEFLPQLPEHALVVLADRNPPASAWRIDPGWQQLVYPWSLRNLRPEESTTYLSRRAIPVAEHRNILEFTHGHPLALSLVADVVEQRPASRFEPEVAPDIVRSLLEQFVQDLPGPAHRVALEACALVRLMTEAVLAAMLEMPDVHLLFEWLRRLSFIESGRTGLFPHDLAREALVTDLRWRNPEWYAELHRRARNYYNRRIRETHEAEQRRYLLDLVYLHRHNAVVRPYFEWQDEGVVWTDQLRPTDVTQLLAMVEQHEGQASAQLAVHWCQQQPDGIRVFRDGLGDLTGFLLPVALHAAQEDAIAADPGTVAVWRFLQSHAPLRPGEKVTHFRFWMDRQHYQGLSPTQSRIFINCVQHYLTTAGLAYTFFSCANPDFWSDVFAYADLARIPAADFSVGERRYGTYGHDWRTMPPAAWLELLAEREVGGPYRQLAPDPPSRPLVVLSQPEFADAVRTALRSFSHPVDLAHSILLGSRLVVQQVGADAGESQRRQTLQNSLREAVDSLQSTPRLRKFHRALYHTYLQPAPTQEMAAELLDLPFSTYRRHLRAGIEQVTEQLWRVELGKPERLTLGRS